MAICEAVSDREHQQSALLPSALGCSQLPWSALDSVAEFWSGGNELELSGTEKGLSWWTTPALSGATSFIHSMYIEFVEVSLGFYNVPLVKVMISPNCKQSSSV